MKFRSVGYLKEAPLEAIISAVCFCENVTLAELRSHSRKRNLVEPRMIFAYLSRECGHTTTSTGNEIDRDHATILNNTKTFMNNWDTNLKGWKERYMKVSNYLSKNADITSYQIVDKSIQRLLIKKYRLQERIISQGLCTRSELQQITENINDI